MLAWPDIGPAVLDSGAASSTSHDPGAGRPHLPLSDASVTYTLYVIAVTQRCATLSSDLKAPATRLCLANFDNEPSIVRTFQDVVATSASGTSVLKLDINRLGSAVHLGSVIAHNGTFTRRPSIGEFPSTGSGSAILATAPLPTPRRGVASPPRR